MPDTRMVVVGLWVAVMLTYLLGDVLRIFAGDFEPGKIAGVEARQAMWLLNAVIMLTPILMVVLNLLLSYSAIRWVNIVVAILLVLFNIAGLPYPGAYDNFLIFVSFVFKGFIVWQAWKWVVRDCGRLSPRARVILGTEVAGAFSLPPLRLSLGAAPCSDRLSLTIE